MKIEISPGVAEQITAIARIMKLSESAVVERCIGHRYKMLTALETHRRNHPNSGWGRTSEYHIWKGIMRRCLDPKCIAYPNYGGRGIKIAVEMQTFQGFLRTVGRRPDGMSLDRIDNDGHYESGNLRWANDTEQNSNKRSNDLIKFRGKSQTLTAWARELGLSQTSLWCRIYKHGWSVTQALSTPRLSNEEAAQRASAEYRGGYCFTIEDIRKVRDSVETQSALAKRYGVSQSTIWRIKNRKRWAKID